VRVTHALQRDGAERPARVIFGARPQWVVSKRVGDGVVVVVVVCCT
jgi:hypothetical protein